VPITALEHELAGPGFGSSAGDMMTAHAAAGWWGADADRWHDRKTGEERMMADVDVVVIGAGPAGQTVAYQLVERGFSVLILDAGGPEVVDPARVRGIARGLPYPYEDTVDEGVGGTARLWCVNTPEGPEHVRFRELDPVDLGGRPEVGVPAWPLHYDELKRWYPQARSIVGLPPRCPSIGTDPIATATRDSVLPMLFEFPDKRCFTTQLPAELGRRGVELRWHQRVEAILSEADASGGRRVKGLRIREGREGRANTLLCQRVVLAAGAVPVAQLLAASPSLLAPQAMEHVGAGFMEHPHANVALLLPSDAALLGDPRVTEMYRAEGRFVERRYHLAARVEREHALLRTSVRWAPTRRRHELDAKAFGAPNSAGVAGLRLAGRGLKSAAPREVSEGFRAATADLPSIGRHVGAQVRFALRRASGRNGLVAIAVAVMEQRRELRRRLVLEAGRAPQVMISVDGAEVADMHRTVEVLDAELRRGGLGSLHPLFRPPHRPQNLGWGHHHMGTTVMSADHDGGVVDTDLKVHGVSGLHVASSAVFPSGGHANPTLTIVALACRLADHLADSGLHR
jgi:choline dehydrogenase-like flavoprotein